MGRLLNPDGRSGLRALGRLSPLLRAPGKIPTGTSPSLFLCGISQHFFQNSMHDQVGIAADRRSEVRVTWRRQREVADVLFRVASLLERAQHQVTQDALFRFACDFGGQLLIHAGSDVNIFRNFDGARLFAGAARGAAVALELHALNGQRADAERVAEGCGDHFEVVDAFGVRLFVDSI